MKGGERFGNLWGARAIYGSGVSKAAEGHLEWSSSGAYEKTKEGSRDEKGAIK